MANVSGMPDDTGKNDKEELINEEDVQLPRTYKTCVNS
jgi:hypothetical protein